ncbi:NAD(P)-binding protein [Lentinus tigrinus ALCF2SS1-7]|uniref:NAD(P)-binding protein n=1 Tax=Lentinus tigrinus ALCF2SS1-6 TaxID=1328759 RepID=A0A5C2S8M6_9APHY|nr:NAD(P)-binding protein [Lentinus tigrinus ALCF2SS1-6]RPD74769.1 NAD(P)-binding protein [Lentinus tigrinus ALCF2SS1-7]
MKVLILGATGFIGLPAAQAFVRAGHIVYGQTRSASKVKQLASEEIIPIVAELKDTAAYLPLVSSIDVIIDAIGGTDLKEMSNYLLSATAEAVQVHRPSHAPKLTYIYTSGTWVHGESRTEVVTDTSALTSPVELVSWRPAQEQRVISNPHLNGIVVRPALLYGRSGSLTAMLFKSAHSGEVVWYGTPGGRMALIHADDLAELYVLAAEKAPIVGGQIFDAANDVTESTDAVLQRLVEISGAKGPFRYIQPSNPFEVALGTTSILRPYLARALLGWRPRKAGLLDHLELYYKAWKANEGLV